MFLVLANFKSHQTAVEVKTWLKAVAPAAKSVPQLEIAAAPSFPHLAITHWPSSIRLAAQDVSPFPLGAYTGAVAAPQLQELGVKYALVGHSERRRHFHETPVEVSNKITELLEVGITPVVCLTADQVVSQFAALNSSVIPQCIYCFEPEDGLGGTETASNEEILSVLARIRQFAPAAPLMYGGSVTPENVASLLPLPVSGVLVATASLNPAQFIKLIQVVGHAR